MTTILPKITSVSRKFIASDEYKKFYQYMTGRQLTALNLFKDAVNFIYPFLGLNANLTLNRDLTTEVSFLFVPNLCFVPLHVCVEKYQMYNDVDYTPRDISVSQEEYGITNFRGEDYYIAPPVGTVAYQRRISIDGRYYRDNDVVWNAFLFKVPDMMNMVWATLEMLPTSVPAFYFSKKMGRFFGQPNFLDKNTLTSSDASLDYSERKIMLLNNIDFSIDSNSDIVTFNIELLESYNTSYQAVINDSSGDLNKYQEAISVIERFGV